MTLEYVVTACGKTSMKELKNLLNQCSTLPGSATKKYYFKTLDLCLICCQELKPDTIATLLLTLLLLLRLRFAWIPDRRPE